MATILLPPSWFSRIKRFSPNTFFYSLYEDHVFCSVSFVVLNFLQITLLLHILLRWAVYSSGLCFITVTWTCEACEHQVGAAQSTNDSRSLSKSSLAARGYVHTSLWHVDSSQIAWDGPLIYSDTHVHAVWRYVCMHATSTFQKSFALNLQWMPKNVLFLLNSVVQ